MSSISFKPGLPQRWIACRLRDFFTDTRRDFIISNVRPVDSRLTWTNCLFLLMNLPKHSTIWACWLFSKLASLFYLFYWGLIKAWLPRLLSSAITSRPVTLPLLFCWDGAADTRLLWDRLSHLSCLLPFKTSSIVRNCAAVTLESRRSSSSSWHFLTYSTN